MRDYVAGGDPLALGSQERRHEVACPVCVGDWKRCKFATCPKLEGVRDWMRDFHARQETSLYGATPPSAFVGQWGYPRVLTGPLVPPTDERVGLMDAEEEWLTLSLQDILALRMSMVRGKQPLDVVTARQPPRTLQTVQEMAMAENPVYAEMRLEERVNLEAYFSPRNAPVGPSALYRSVDLAENPAVPRRVDYVVSDTDLKAGEGTWDLYRHDIGQRHITRVLSLGLLGTEPRRRLVPTEWSITAVDDILGRRLRDRVRDHPQLGEVRLYGHSALANNVQILLLPGPWMFEGLEGWEGHGDPVADHEGVFGRKGYPTNLLGAYHAARLPVLEHLDRTRRQATAIAFLEVYREWVPLGVWRFRELAREAFRRGGERFATLGEALDVLSPRLRIPLNRWLRQSRLYRFYREQRRLEDFVEPGGPPDAPRTV